jgi:OOP family OmpA-OmpF porin
MNFIKQKWLGAACIVIGALITSSAYAQWYAGVGAGQATVKIPDVSTTTVTGSGNTTKGTSYKLFGGYQFTPNWGAELAYNNLGSKYSATFTDKTTGSTGFAPFKLRNAYFAGTGTLPLGGGFALFAKVGMVKNQTQGSGACAGATCVPVGQDKTRTQPFMGAGAEFPLGKTLALRLEYEDYGKVSNDDIWGTGASGSVKANSWFLSLKANF